VGLADEGDWGGIATPLAGLAAATSLSLQKVSQQGRWPNGPPKTKPSRGARQPPASLHDLQPLCCLSSPAHIQRRADAHEPHLSATDITGVVQTPKTQARKNMAIANIQSCFFAPYRNKKSTIIKSPSWNGNTRIAKYRRMTIGAFKWHVCLNFPNWRRQVE